MVKLSVLLIAVLMGMSGMVPAQAKAETGVPSHSARRRTRSDKGKKHRHHKSRLHPAKKSSTS